MHYTTMQESDAMIKIIIGQRRLLHDEAVRNYGYSVRASANATPLRCVAYYKRADKKSRAAVRSQVEEHERVEWLVAQRSAVERQSRSRNYGYRISASANATPLRCVAYYKRAD